MQREKFKKHLIQDGLTKNGVNARILWANRVEREFMINLDFVVNSKKNTLELIKKIMNYNKFTKRQQYNFPNAIRKYYTFINGVQLGSLRENYCIQPKKNQIRYFKT